MSARRPFLVEDSLLSSTPKSKSEQNGGDSLMFDMPARQDCTSSFSRLFPDQEDSTKTLQRAHTLARQSLSRAEMSNGTIPSRLLRPSELSVSDFSILNASSTISESDLLPNDSSTPRNSSLSFGQYIGRMSTALKSNVDKTENILDDFFKNKAYETKSLSPGGSFFSPVEDPAAKLMADELEWRKREVPSHPQEFSINQVSDGKDSIGDFFKNKSDSLSLMFVKSPEKADPPKPLVESSMTAAQKDITLNQNHSLGLSAIENILHDTNQTPNRAMELLFNAYKGPKKSPKKSTREWVEQSKPVKAREQLSVVLDAEAVVNQKENLSPVQTEQETSPNTSQDKTLGSLRSSSSLSSLPEGKLPIEATKSQIVWGCVKLGKRETQEFVLRNRSSSRLRIQCTTANPAFKIIGVFDEAENSVKVVLHPYESRTFKITFSPGCQGAAVDRLYFTPIEKNLEQKSKQFIRLSGYGGYGLVTVGNVAKDTVGKLVLSLGYVGAGEITRSFTLRNTGTLPTFACISFVSQTMYSFSSVKVRPKNLILLPEQEAAVEVCYEPQKDLELFFSKLSGAVDVIDMGRLVVFWGTEVDRGRLRRVVEKNKSEISPVAKELCEKFENEMLPADLKLFKELPSGIDEILQFFKSREISLIVERDLDKTVVAGLDNDTRYFQSLCGENSVDADSTLMDIFVVEPSKIILNPPIKKKDCIFVTNNGYKNFCFEINCVPKGLEIVPKEGILEPSKTLPVRVAFNAGGPKVSDFTIKVLIENECQDVYVKVLSTK